MIIARLIGGLGNQMFQYAAGLRLARRHNTKMKLDIRILLNRNPNSTRTVRDFDLPIFQNCNFAIASEKECCKFTDDYSIANKMRNFLNFPPRLIQEIETPAFMPEILTAPNNVYLDGYWQSELYFNDIDTEITKCFYLDKSTNNTIADLGRSIATENSVCLNVRRADYVNNINAVKTHGCCEVSYYKRSLDYLSSKINSLKIYIFSDDIDWCRANLKFDLPYTVVGHEYAGGKFRDYLWLMTQCQHFIIPNSTFAWWAAWLASYKHKIIVAPNRWFADDNREKRATMIVPKHWIRIQG